MNLSRKILAIAVLIFLVLFSYSSKAQTGLPATYSNLFSLNASRYLPSMLGENIKHVQVSVINGYSYLSNNTFSLGFAKDLLNSDQITNSDIDQVIENLKSSNLVMAGTQIEPINAAIKISSDDKEILTIGFGMAERVESHILYSNNLFKLAWKGNKQFAGSPTNLGPFAGHFMYNREFRLGIGVPIRVSESINLKAGAALKLLQGIASAQLVESDALIYTDPDGKYVDLDYNFQLQTAFPDKFNPFKSIGSGTGFDIGLGLNINDQFFADLGLTDMGSVRYGESAKTYTGGESVRLDGFEIENIFEELDFQGDSITIEIEKPVTTEEAFSIQLPTKLTMQFAYRIKAENAKGYQYYKHSTYFTYHTTSKSLGANYNFSYVGVGYNYDWSSFLNVGMSAGLFNMEDFSLGAFIGGRMGPIRIGTGSSNILAIFSPSSVKGTDAHFNLSVAF